MSILPYPTALSRFTHRTVALLLPASCLLCGGDSENELVCAACIAELPQLAEPCCPLCADRTTHGERCGACLKDPPAFSRAFAAYRYDYPLDRIIHALKYGHQLAVADWCAGRLAPLAGHAHFDRILPLPLHVERLRERGFNQSGEIAKALGRRLDLPVDLTSLLRTRATPPQAELEARGFTAEDFARSHPGGRLGRRLLLLIDDVMHVGDQMPRSAPDDLLKEALLEMSRKGLGTTVVVDSENGVLGVFTDGDLRRALDRQVDVHTARVAEVMTRRCKTIAPGTLAAEALQKMQQYKINALPVVNSAGKLTGVLNMHDLLRAGVL